MAFTKLSAEDKQAIVQLYQEVGQTAATVAKQFSVSVSTISRLLKSELPPEAYDALVRQKRGGGETKSKKRTSRKKPISKLKKSVARSAAEEDTASDAATELEPEVTSPSDEVSEISEAPASRSRRRRSRTVDKKKRPVSRRRTKKLVESAADASAEQQPTSEAPESGQTDESQKDEAEEIILIESSTDTEETAARPSRSRRRTRPRLKPDTPAEASTDGEAVEAEVSTSSPTKRRTRTRTRTRAAVADELAPEATEASADKKADDAADLASSEVAEVELQTEADLTLEDLGEDLSNGAGEDEDFEDAFEGEDDLDEDGGDSSGDNITSLRRRSSAADVVQIQPLSEANLSRMLYLVIDRTADLITMPMVFFSDLGQLPEEEEEKKTLPVFENHRVARRFSQRNQRVIKVPDGELISKTAPWLEAKGITRCLLDGQVYSLESADR